LGQTKEKRESPKPKEGEKKKEIFFLTKKSGGEVLDDDNKGYALEE